MSTTLKSFDNKDLAEFEIWFKKERILKNILSKHNQIFNNKIFLKIYQRSLIYKTFKFLYKKQYYFFSFP